MNRMEQIQIFNITKHQLEAYVTTNYVPRIGESIYTENKTFRVVDVKYRYKHTNNLAMIGQHPLLQTSYIEIVVEEVN